MGSEIEQLQEELAVGAIRPKRADRVQEVRESSFREYSPEQDTAMTLEQAKRFSNAVERDVSSTMFDSDAEMFEICERVINDWPRVEVYFSGQVDEYGYIDGIYFSYECVSNEKTFREYCVIHFKERMSVDAADNEGICPFCNDDITLSGIEVDSVFHPRSQNDDNLWVAPDEFNFREYPDYGKCLRIWFDD